MTKYISILLACTISSISWGHQLVLAKFRVTSGTQNRVDITKTLVSQKAYTVFYKTTKNDSLYMANVWDKNSTQSFGVLYPEYSKETRGADNAKTYHFKWAYRNDYDSKHGMALITIEKIFKPKRTLSVLTIITDHADTLIYKGYMEGSLR